MAGVVLCAAGLCAATLSAALAQQPAQDPAQSPAPTAQQPSPSPAQGSAPAVQQPSSETAPAEKPSPGPSQVPVFVITPAGSSITFHVKASVTVAGKFDKWHATLTMPSPDATTGILDIKVEADSVDTGSGFKNGKLKSKGFFDVKQNPWITFRSTKVIQTGPHAFEVDGDFTIRGVSNPEKMTLRVHRSGPGSGEINGSMVFNRKDYGINGSIPFIRIADHVDVNFHLRVKHVSGPPINFKP
jgi:polyisoprenoid-binding protein YceI